MATGTMLFLPITAKPRYPQKVIEFMQIQFWILRDVLATYEQPYDPEEAVVSSLA
jgi:hypothetical protein